MTASSGQRVAVGFQPCVVTGCWDIRSRPSKAFLKLGRIVAVPGGFGERLDACGHSEGNMLGTGENVLGEILLDEVLSRCAIGGV